MLRYFMKKKFKPIKHDEIWQKERDLDHAVVRGDKILIEQLRNELVAMKKPLKVKNKDHIATLQPLSDAIEGFRKLPKLIWDENQKMYVEIKTKE